jgi:hypothetical protein
LTPTEKRTPVDAKATCERCNRFSRLPDVVVLDLVEPGDDGVVRIHVELVSIPAFPYTRSGVSVHLRSEAA